MDDKPTQDLATRAFQKRVLDEFAAVRAQQAEMRKDVGELRKDVAEVQRQQAAMAQNIAALDQRLTTLEQRVDERLKETRPIWEAVQVQIQRLGEKLDAILMDFYELRGELKLHGRRLAELEGRVLP